LECESLLSLSYSEACLAGLARHRRTRRSGDSIWDTNGADNFGGANSAEAARQASPQQSGGEPPHSIWAVERSKPMVESARERRGDDDGSDER
jgi:hypothetical protein